MKLINKIKFAFLILAVSGFSAKAQAGFILAGQHGPGDYFHDFIPDTLVQTTAVSWPDYPIDINNDGITDFKFTLYPSSGALGMVHYYCYIKAQNNNRIVVGGSNTCNTSKMAKCLILNDSVNAPVNWDTLAYLQIAYSSMGGGCGAHYTQNSIDTGFIGLKVCVGTSTLYGWIKVDSLQCDFAAAKYAFKLGAFACNTKISALPEFTGDAVRVFPVPADRTLKLELKNYKSIVAITDVLGKIISEEKVEWETKTYDVSNLEEGIYFLHIKLPSEGTLTKKIIVQH